MKNCWISMLGRVLFGLFTLIAFAFSIPSGDIYDQVGYYLFPIRPGEINYLSGSMGELRSTHFHSGIDIKTGGVEGYNVYAAADGFVNRVKVSTGGYGKAIYIQHPNNTFTVYAHLKDFSKDLADYVRRQQYKKRSYEVDLFPPKGRFSFSKGDIIASSGNTGSSTAPHLHFEIRDGNHKILDPLRFGFSEIIDTRPPEIQRIAFKTLDINSRVNGRFGRLDFPVVKEGGIYKLQGDVNIQGNVGVELYAFDRQNGTRNRYGIPCLEFYFDDNLKYSHQIRTFSFGETRNLLVHTDYPHMIRTRRRYHKLYKADGNNISFYEPARSGVIHITDSLSHQIDLKLSDVDGNATSMSFQINEKPLINTKENFKALKRNFQIEGNVLRLVHESEDKHIVIYANRFGYELEPVYSQGDNSIYLWDLREGLPDSIDFCGEVKQMNLKATVPSGLDFDYFSDDVDLSFGKKTLFDTLYLDFEKSIIEENESEVFSFNHRFVPVRRSVKVTLKPELDYSHDNSFVYSKRGDGNLSFVGGKWNGDEISFFTRDLVNFTIASDTVPPNIKTVRINSDNFSFIIEDDLSGIKSYEAYVNGEWVLMNYESKRNLVWSEKLDQNIPYAGELLFSVIDHSGNQSDYRTQF